MKLIKHFILLTLISFNASANFGFGPCCSGSPCGIVPCDNSCAGPALLNLGQSFFQGANRVSEQSVQLSAEGANASVQSATFYTQLGGRLVAQSLSLIRALDGLVGRYDGATTISTDSWQRLSDNLASQLHQSLSSGGVLEQVSTHNNEFGQYSDGPSYQALSERLENAEDVGELTALFSSFYSAALGHRQLTDDARQTNTLLGLIKQRAQEVNSEMMVVPPYSQLNESNVLANLHAFAPNNEKSVLARMRAQVTAAWLSNIVPIDGLDIGSLEQDWQALRSAPLIDSQYQQNLALANEAGLMRESVLLLQQQASMLMQINEVSHRVDLIQALQP